MIATIYGTNFGTSASAVSVTVGGKAAYVFTPVTANQIAVEIPFEVPVGPTTLTVTVAKSPSAPFNITLAATAPAVTTLDSSGAGLVAAYQNSGTPVNLTSPARPGDNVFVYALGLGPTSPASVTGVPAATNISTLTLPAVTVGGVPAKVLFAGIPAGQTAVYQINFTVPPNAQGTQPLVVSIGGQSSSGTVTFGSAGLSSIVNSGSLGVPGTASPGSIVAAFANGLGTTTNVLSGLFPATKSGGVQVTFNGIPAPLFTVVAASAQQQLNLFVPTELPTSGTVNVQLTTSNALYPNYSLTMVPANPGFYRLPDPKVTTRFNVIAQFAGSTWLVLPSATTAALGLPVCGPGTSKLTICGQPATIGDLVVLYATGLGLATPNGDPNGRPLATGTVAPADGSVLYKTPTLPVITVGGIPATVLFSGIVPGIAGEYQINIQVPSGVTNGDDIPVQITILGASDTATISIQPRSN